MKNLPPSRFCRAIFGGLVAALCLQVPGALLAQDESPAAVPVPPTPAVTTEPAAPKPATEPSPTPAPGVENSVVKIFATVRYPDSYRPWAKQSPRDISGSGAVIVGKRILTNAHVVLYASQILVQANQSGDKLAATVEAVAPGIDLAVLKLDDESFFDAHPALPLAKTLPDIKDAVLVYGYPQGGSSLSITKGIVSRIEFSGYNPPVSGLRIQIDAAINPGNSGGPAVAGESMIGLAFSRLQGGAENIGYIIPGEEIELFLADIKDGKYDGKPSLRDNFQTLENPALRAFLKLDKGVSGMVVHEPYKIFKPEQKKDPAKEAKEAKNENHDDDPSDAFKEWDVVTKMGDVSVDDQGMVKIGPNLRVSFLYLVQKQAKDDKLTVTVVRQSKEKTLTLPVPTQYPTLIPDVDGGYPSYFVYGPLAFENVNTQFIAGLTSAQGSGGFGRWAYGGSPLLTRLGDQPKFEGERLVAVSSPFFPNKLAKGYDSAFGEVVETVNGQHVKNLNDLVAILRDLKDPFVTIEFQGRTGEALVFPRAETAAATEDILTDNGVRSQGSPDTLAIWNAKK